MRRGVCRGDLLVTLPAALIAFSLRRLLTLAVLPMGVITALLLVALWTRKRRWIATALITLYLSATPLVGDRLVGLLESQYPELDVEECPSSDALVVLGGLVSGVSPKDGRAIWSDAVDRFGRGVQLAQARRAPWLILTGGDIPEAGQTEGDVMRREAIAHGVPSEAIHVVRGVANTEQEARAVAEFAEGRDIHRITLVTSAFHMRRAKLLFNRQGLEVIPFPTDYRRMDQRPLEALDFLPQADGFNNTEVALKEFYGLLYYSIHR